MTNTRFLIFLTALGLIGLMAYWMRSQVPEAPEPDAADALVPELRRKVPPIQMPPDFDVQQAREREDKLAEKQKAELLARLQTRKRMEAIASSTPRRWEELRWRKLDLVNHIIRTNLDTFRTLKIKARMEDDSELRCTLCDGDAVVDYCVMCDTKGDCPTCKGTGLEPYGDGKPCITCEGRKTCFFCVGQKKMKCLFCEKGRVTTITRMPSNRLELP